MAVVTVLCHHPRSGSGALLANALRERGINASTATSASRRATRGHRTIINYGVSTPPTAFRQGSVTWSNTCEAVANCSDKLRTLATLYSAQVPCIDWARSTLLSGNWLGEDGKIVVRHVVNGHSGQGIEIVRRGNPIPNAPLYTRYFRKDAEYRVHVAFGDVILIQQKKRENGHAQQGEEHLIRTRANGYVFSVNDLACDSRNYRSALCDLALRAAAAVGANHCAVDLLVRHSDPVDMRVVEINSAAALRSPSSLNAYVNAFQSWISTL